MSILQVHSIIFFSLPLMLNACASAPDPIRPEAPVAVVTPGPHAEVQEALRQGRAAEALALAESWSVKERGEITWTLYKAQALAQLERYEEAMELAEQARRAQGDVPGPRLIKGRLLWIDGEFDEAADEFKAALEMDPRCGEAMTYLGLVLIQGGKYSEAVVVLEGALSFSPDDIQVLNNLGVACAATGNLQRARELYEKAVTLTPVDPKLRNNLADVLLRLGEAKEASTQIDELVRLSPDRSNALRLQRDLVTVGVVVDAVCRKQKAVITRVEAAFVERGWSKDDAAESLRRVTGDPLFDAMVLKAVQSCPAP